MSPPGGNGTGWGGPQNPSPPAPRTTPSRPAWLSVNTILVGVGALLLAVAAIGFLIFSWQSMPLAARAAVIASITVTALGAATWLRPRLPETAEAVGALAVVLVLGDTWAVRSTGLFGADRPEGFAYAGAALLITGALLDVWGRTTKVRAGTHAAAVQLPLGTFCLVAEVLDDWIPGLLLAAAVTLTRRTLPAAWRSERVIARVMAVLMLLTAVVPTWLGLPDLVPAVLAAVGITLVLAAQTWADGRARAIVGAGLVGPATASAGAVGPGPHKAESDRAGSVDGAMADSATATAGVESAGTERDGAGSNRGGATGVRAAGGKTAVDATAGAGSVHAGSADGATAAAGWGRAGSPGAAPAGVRPDWAGVKRARAGVPGLRLNRAWSLAAGVSAAAAATLAGTAVAYELELDYTVGLIPVTLLPGLLVVAISFLTPSATANLRRTAVSAGVLATSALVALPGLCVALWQPLRPLQEELRSHSADTRLENVGAEQSDLTRFWAVAIVCLLIVAAVTWAAGRRGSWPQGPWPTRVRAGLNRAPVPLVASTIVVVVLAPGLPVFVTVAALILLSAVSAGLAVRPPFSARKATRRALTPGLWIASVLTGVLAVALAWTTRELPGGVTALAAVALFAARRRRPGSDENARLSRAALALLGASAVPAALIVLADQAGAPDELPLVWAALITGLGSAALLTAPRLPLPPNAGRANWGSLDRLAAATPGIATLGIALAAVIDDPNVPDWALPALLAVVLVIAVSGALLAQSVLANRYPVLPQILSAASTPTLGLLVVAGRDAWWPDTAPTGMLWALSMAVGTVAVLLLVLGGHANTPHRQKRRFGAEVGLALSGAIAVAAAVGSAGKIWPTLLIVGVAAAAISLTPDREKVGWVAGLLLTASFWLRLADSSVELVEAYTVPPALALLAVQLWIRSQRPSQNPGQNTRLAKKKQPAGLIGQTYGDLGILARPLLIGVAPSVLACATFGLVVRPIALLALAALAVVGGIWLLRKRPGNAQPVRAVMLAGVLVAVGTAVLRVVHELGTLSQPEVPLTSLEVWTAPAALLLLLRGVDRFQQWEKQARGEQEYALSWSAFGPGLFLLLGPSLVCALSETEGPVARPFLVIAVAAVTVAVGSSRRMQAPVLLGAAVLVVQALVLLSPWMREVGETVPLWAWAAIVGLALLVLGGGYERRLAQLRTVRSRLAALR